jgi:hypothetical protein
MQWFHQDEHGYVGHFAAILLQSVDSQRGSRLPWAIAPPSDLCAELTTPWPQYCVVGGGIGAWRSRPALVRKISSKVAQVCTHSRHCPSVAQRNSLLSLQRAAEYVRSM